MRSSCLIEPEIKPDRLTWPRIRKAADDARHQYTGSINTVPVPIDRIIEIDLGIDIQPEKGLIVERGFDAYISNDLKTISIDQEVYDDERFSNRRRFTLAHELGHIILHRNIIEKIIFTHRKDWWKFHSNMKCENLEWFENQAREFAGRFLVPRERLIDEINKRRAGIASGTDCEKVAIWSLYMELASFFKVSDEVIGKRIFKENLEMLTVSNDPGDDDIPF